jgi:hypothetical protein
MKKEDIVGVWRSGGQKVFDKDGSVRSQRGPTPGCILYTADGYMMVVSTDPAGVSADDPARMTTEQKAKAAESCTAYCGPYEFDGHTVLHHVEVGLFPAWADKTRVRHASLEGRRMTFVTDPNPDGSVSHIYWDRM